MILVTGASGFLGRHLVTHLAGSGFRVRALVRADSHTRYIQDLAELAVGDVLDPASLADAAEGCQYVVHAAALFRFWGNREAFERTNVQGTANMLEAARRRGVERFIHISTIAVVGHTPREGQIDETTPCSPADPYQRSKYDGENFVRMFSKGAGLPAIILRPGAFYGPWGHYAFNRLFFEDPLKGLRIQVHSGKRYTFPVFVPDVCRAVVTALKLGRPGEVYNISGESLTHRAANTLISRLAGMSSFRINIPEKIMLMVARYLTRRAERTGHEPYYPINLAGYVFQDWRVSSAKAQAELGFTATPFEEGARQTLEWYWHSGLFKRPRHVPATPAPTPVVANPK
jgi:dihydroflavonol-4-reductase